NQSPASRPPAPEKRWRRSTKTAGRSCSPTPSRHIDVSAPHHTPSESKSCSKGRANSDERSDVIEPGQRTAEAVAFVLNGQPCTVAVERDALLLYVLRNDLGLKGTRFGCGMGLC